jgi:hypothetical protein
VPDPTDVPVAGGLAEAVGITGSRGVGRRRGDRTRVRLLTAAAIAAALLAVALILSARQPDAEPVAAGASEASGSAASPSSNRRLPATRPPAGSRTASPAPSARPGGADEGGDDAPGSEEPAPPPTTVARSAPPQPVPERAAAESAAAAAPAAAPRAPPAAEPVERLEEPAKPAGPTDAAPAAQLGGRWELTHQVESSSYRPYQGMRLGYQVTLFQEGDRVYGQGRKVSENGVELPEGQRTPIDVAGRIEDGQVVLYFTEIGASRTSRGTIRWRLAPADGNLEGRFATDAANSSGVSHGRRLP